MQLEFEGHCIGVCASNLKPQAESYRVTGMIIFKLFQVDLLVILPWLGPGTCQCVRVLRPGRQFYRSALAFKRLFAIDTFVNEPWPETWKPLGIRVIVIQIVSDHSIWCSSCSSAGVSKQFRRHRNQSYSPDWWNGDLQFSIRPEITHPRCALAIAGLGITSSICSPLSESSLIHSRG